MKFATLIATQQQQQYYCIYCMYVDVNNRKGNLVLNEWYEFANKKFFATTKNYKFSVQERRFLHVQWF